MTLSQDLTAAAAAAAELESALAAAIARGDAAVAELDKVQRQLVVARARVKTLEQQLADCTGGAQPVGVSPGFWQGMSADEQNRQLDDMAACGIGAFRFAPEWSGFEPRAGEFHFEKVRSATQRILEHDMLCVICPTYPPEHARVVPTQRFGEPKVASVRSMAEAYGLATKELGPDVGAGRRVKTEWTNEPNLLYWRPPDPVKYAATLDAFRTGMLKGDPKAELITAGLAPAKQNPPNSVAPATFVEQMYATARCLAPGAAAKVHGVGFHPYMGGNPPNTIAVWSTMGPIWDQIVATIRSRPAPHPLIYSTEFGYSTAGDHGVSEALQAQYLVEQIELFRGRPETAGPPFVHRWIDFHPGQFAGLTPYNEQLGVHWHDGTPKLAKAALRELLT